MNKTKIYLVQTDTTVGFLSSDDKKLADIKQRPSSQKMLQVVNSFKTLKKQTRIPKKFRKIVRNSNQTTFIYPNRNSYRVISNSSPHHNFINKFEILYSSSANITKNKFDKTYAIQNCDVVVEDSRGYFESTPSNIFKINKAKIKKLR